MSAKKFVLNSLALTSILLSLVLVSPVYANEDKNETSASGTFSIVSVVGNTVTFDFDGTLNGSLVCTQTAEVDFADNKVEVTCSGTFTGTVDGASGSMQGVGQGSGTISPFTLQGEFKFSDGTGGLKDLEVELDFNQVGFSGNYSGKVQ